VLRKAAVVLLTAVLVPLGVPLQSQLLLGFLVVALLVHLRLQPFTDGFTNALETLSLGTLLFTFWAGSVSSNLNQGSNAAEILAVLVLLSNVLVCTVAIGGYARAKAVTLLTSVDAARGAGKHQPKTENASAKEEGREPGVNGAGGRDTGGGGDAASASSAERGAREGEEKEPGNGGTVVFGNPMFMTNQSELEMATIPGLEERT